MAQYIQLFVGFILALFLHLGVLAQTPGPLTQKALEYAESNDLMQARDQILTALKDKDESKMALTWHTKAYIYKEIYKLIDHESRHSENREIAVDAVLRSMEIDDDAELLDANINAMRFLSLSYYNDAVAIIRSLSEENYEEAEKFYKRYRQLYQLCGGPMEFEEKDTEFYRNYAFALRNLSDQSETNANGLNALAIEYYGKALSISPEDYASNYNLAVIHYNRGAQKIRAINHQTEIFELIVIQEECLKHFKSALPYMRKAHSMIPESKDTLKGLMAIYRALNDDEESAKYKEELERLIRAGIIRD